MSSFYAETFTNTHPITTQKKGTDAVHRGKNINVGQPFPAHNDDSTDLLSCHS
jgi:hypothetical protein